MRRFFRIALLTLVLMTVALISALTAMRLAIHGREVTIPRVLGMGTLEAERAGSALGLQVIVEREFYSADVPEGKIVNQMPASGTKVRRGWSIRVARSLGPQRVAIPDVAGESERAAELNIRRRGLALGSVAEISFPADSPNAASIQLDQVVSQSPPPNASGVSAPKISLLVTGASESPAYVMPNFTGQPLGSATLALQDAGMRVGKVSVLAVQGIEATQAVASSPQGTYGPQPLPIAPQPMPSQPGTASMIVTQWPAPGQKVSAGAAVSFEVR